MTILDFLKKKKNKKGKSISEIDFSYLSCEHHLAMVTGIGLSCDNPKILLVGLGGGLLATYIHKYLENVSLHVFYFDIYCKECLTIFEFLDYLINETHNIFNFLGSFDYCRN